jgi:hypothetical protein
MIHSLKGRYDLDEGYNTAAAKSIRPVAGGVQDPAALKRQFIKLHGYDFRHTLANG